LVDQRVHLEQARFDEALAVAGVPIATLASIDAGKSALASVFRYGTKDSVR